MSVKKQKIEGFALSAVRMIILIGLCFVILYPLFTKLMISFMTMEDLYDASVIFTPRRFTLDNYSLGIKYSDYWLSLLKSIGYIGLLSVLQIASSVLVGYGFARFKFRGSGLLFACVLLTLIIPAQSYMLPLFFHFKSLGLLGTKLPMALLSVGCVGLKNGLYVYMFRQYFRSFPKELEEAGEVDGAGTFRIFMQIVLPGAVGIIVTCLLFSFVWLWTDTFYSSIFMPDNSLISTRLVRLGTTVGSSSTAAADPYYNAIMQNVAVVLLILPIAIVFFAAQRFFVESIERSGITG